MDSLSQVLSRVKEQLARDALCSAVVFPRTESLQDIARVTLDAMNLEDLSIQQCLKSHPEFIALYAREDLLLIVNLLKSVNAELYIDKFDGVVIYKGGLDLLTIRFPNSVGRTVYVDMNDYRRRIISLVNKRKVKYEVLIPVVSVVLVTIVSIITSLRRS